MRTSSSNSSRHQIVLSLTPSGADVLHLQRSLFGWKRIHQAHFDLPTGEVFFQALRQNLTTTISDWNIPPNVFAFWIITPDILGVISSSPGKTGLPSSSLPFPPSTVKTQVDNFGGEGSTSLLWIHNDWLSEIERISRDCRLLLVECFARSQIFQNFMSQASSSKIKILVEGNPDALCLHIFDDKGKILRSRILTSNNSLPLSSTLNAEISSIKHYGEENSKTPISLWTSEEIKIQLQDFASSNNWKFQKEFDNHLMSENLWRSGIEGIVLRPTHQHTVRTLLLAAGAIGAAGLLVLFGLMWHKGILTELASEQESELRKIAPSVKKAKDQKALTIRMADLVRAGEHLEKANQATDTFIQLLTIFPPSPATLLYFHASPQKIELAGGGSESDIRKIKENPILGYTSFVEMPAPEFLAAKTSEIHLRATSTTQMSQPSENSNKK